MLVEEHGSIGAFHSDHGISARAQHDDCSTARPLDSSPGRSILFGPFKLCPGAREIKRDGIRLAIGSRALDILIALAERAGEVVSHKELTRLVWRGLVVSPGNLRVHITALRKALGTDKKDCRYIANIPGQGYCFVAPIRRLDPVAAESGKAGLAIQAIAEILRNLGIEEHRLLQATADLINKTLPSRFQNAATTF